MHLVNVGNEAVQINFMEAHERGAPTPPQPNIDAFVRYARDLVELGHVDAILITCSTMNRAYPAVAEALRPWRIPVDPDRPADDGARRAPRRQDAGRRHARADGGQHAGPAAARRPPSRGRRSLSTAMTVEEAWHRLAEGDVQGHNDALARAIRAQQAAGRIDSVVLAQLSMTVFLLSHPDPVAEFGIPVFTSGQCGFERVAEVLRHG